MNLLAAGKLDTNVISRTDKSTASAQAANLAPHDQNIKNMKRKNDFMSGIAQCVTIFTSS